MTAMGMYFRTLRGYHDFTQPYVAGQVGVDKGTVWRWENEGRRPDGPALNALLDTLHGDMEDIKVIDADPDNVEMGERLAERRYAKYERDRVAEVIEGIEPEELDYILDEMRAEALRNPNVLDTLRSLLASWRGRADDRSH